MKLQQISVFLGNQAGRLAKVCAALAAAGVNIEAMDLAQGGTGDFGVLRLLVKDPAAALAVLQADFAASASEVVAARIPDKVGALSDVMQIVAKNPALNVEYMYGFSSKKIGTAAMIMRFNDMDAAAELLASNGVSLVGAAELFD
ncbi:MAG: amino acid-binding protein [Thermoguttaceae bacterium]|nr:amino acid-binding protein [Thermoguttaceae bacterium]